MSISSMRFRFSCFGGSLSCSPGMIFRSIFRGSPYRRWSIPLSWRIMGEWCLLMRIPWCYRIGSCIFLWIIVSTICLIWLTRLFFSFPQSWIGGASCWISQHFLPSFSLISRWWISLLARSARKVQWHEREVTHFPSKDLQYCLATLWLRTHWDHSRWFWPSFIVLIFADHFRVECFSLYFFPCPWWTLTALWIDCLCSSIPPDWWQHTKAENLSQQLVSQSWSNQPLFWPYLASE